MKTIRGTMTHCTWHCDLQTQDCENGERCHVVSAVRKNAEWATANQTRQVIYI